MILGGGVEGVRREAASKGGEVVVARLGETTSAVGRSACAP